MRIIRVLTVSAMPLLPLSGGGCGWVEWPPRDQGAASSPERPVPTMVAGPVGRFPNPIPKPVPRPPVRPVEEPAPAAAVPPVMPLPNRPVTTEIRVARGDTLYALAQRHEVSVRSIIEANRLTPPYALAAGQRLVLPRDREHAVADGETIYGISRAYGIDAYDLATANGLVPPFALRVGQRLRIPATGDAPAAPAAEATQMAAAPGRTPIPAAVPPPPPAGGGFLWPVDGRVISSFGAKGKGLHNDGVNIAAARGTPVRAAENGVVAYAGNELRGFGNMLLIKHAGGWITAYAHNEELLVRRGDKVRRGQVIARVGSTGSVTRPQLHFELRKGKQAVDPQKYLRRAGA